MLCGARTCGLALRLSRFRRTAAAAAACAWPHERAARAAGLSVAIMCFSTQLQIGTGWVSEVLLEMGTPPGMRAATCRSARPERAGRGRRRPPAARSAGAAAAPVCSR